MSWPFCRSPGNVPVHRAAPAELTARISARVEERLGPAALDRLGAAFVGTIHAYCFRLLQQYVPTYETYDVLDERRLTAFLCRVERRLDLRSLTRKQFASIKTFLANLDVVENELLEVERMAGALGKKVSLRDLPQARLCLSDDQGRIDALDARSGDSDAGGTGAYPRTEENSSVRERVFFTVWKDGRRRRSYRSCGRNSRARSSRCCSAILIWS